jgi:methyl-accepting chemotaxis protein
MLGEEIKNTVERRLAARRDQFAIFITPILGWSAMAIALALLVSWYFLRDYKQLPMLSAVLAILGVTSLCIPVFYKRGLGAVGLRLGLLVAVAGLTAIGLVSAEFLPAMAVDYGLMVMCGFLLLGQKEGFWAFGLSVAGLLGVYVGTRVYAVPWPVPLAGTSGLLLGIGFTLTAVLLSGVAVRQLIRGQEEALRQAEEARLENLERAAVEQQQRELLQATVTRYVATLVEFSQGNLVARVQVDGDGQEGPDDPLVTLGRGFNEMASHLQEMVQQMHAAAENLGSAAAEILAATTQQASGASEQSAAIAQAGTTIDEVRAIAEQTAGRAQGVADTAQRVADVANAGEEAVGETIDGMEEVTRKVETIAQNVLALSEQAQAIGQVIATVNEIASQSNMLALNAAVEAARAGEAGRGFAVVAGEVRALAEQSRAATEHVRDILTEIQRGVNAAVMATEEGIKGTQVGMRVAEKAKEAIRRLAEGVAESAQASLQIVAAVGQQLAGIEQIALAMHNTHQVTGQTLASARQSEQAAEELDRLAGDLREVVSQYAVGER